jgi:hypothetical protein
MVVTTYGDEEAAKILIVSNRHRAPAWTPKITTARRL